MTIGLWRWALAAFVLAMGAPAPLLAKCEIGQMLELKVTMSGMQPLVSATINGHDVQFVADSGAFYSSISPGSAAELGLSLGAAPFGFYVRGIGGDAQASVATVKSFVLAGVTIPHVQFLVSGSEVGGVGLLGQNVLGIGDVEYDLQDGAIRLMRAKDCANANLAYWAKDKPVSIVTVDVRSPRNPHTTGTILLNGIKIKAIFDTGANTSILSLAAAARAGIRPDSPGVKPAGTSRGLGRRVIQNWIAPVDSLKIGDEEIKRVKIRIGDIGLDDTDMLVGADFFLSHRVYVANGLHKLFFTYDGGPVFNVTPGRVLSSDGTEEKMPTNDTAAPTDAEGFSRRGAAFAARHQYDEAIADFTRATALAPTVGRYDYQRAMAELGKKQPLEAASDLDKAILLSPDDVDARLARAVLRIRVPDKPEAREDIDAVAKIVDKASDKRFEIGALYQDVDAFDEAIVQYDLWIKAHPDDSRRAAALNQRCWARAQMGHELDKALADCSTSIRLQPHVAAVLDSRGLVHLRMGDFDKAIADYDAGLALSPRMAWSLYGRGIAERRKGLGPKGDADIAAATAIDPKLADRARSLGVTP